MKNARKSTDPYYAIFATRLREIMDDTDTTQEMLAKQTGMTRQSISQYMDGSVLPNIEKLQIICNYFNVPSDYLLGLTNSKSKDISDQHIKDKIGLSNEAINKLKDACNEGRSELLTETLDFQIVDLFDYMLSNQNFMDNYTERLLNYFSARIESDYYTQQTGKNDINKNADIAKYLLTNLIARLADECYIDFFRPHFDERKRKKPGRKRKED